MLSKLLLVCAALSSSVGTSTVKDDAYDVQNNSVGQDEQVNLSDFKEHLNLRHDGAIHEIAQKNSDMQLDASAYTESTYIVTYQFADTTCDNYVSTETISSKSYTSAYAYALKKCFQDKTTTNDYIRYKISENVPGQSDGYYIQTYLNNPCTSVPPNAASSLIVINVCNVAGTTSSYTTSSATIPTFSSSGTMFAGYNAALCQDSPTYISWAKPSTCYTSFNTAQNFAISSCTNNVATNSYYSDAQCTTSSGTPVGNSYSCTAGNNLNLATSAADYMSSYCSSTVTIQPTMRPTAVPSPAFKQSRKLDCFAGSEIVVLESGEIKTIEALVFGDRVQSMNPMTGLIQYSDIIAIPHGKNNQPGDFLQILTLSGKDVKVTGNHLMLAFATTTSSSPSTCSSTTTAAAAATCESKPLSSFSLILASELKINDCVWTVDGADIIHSLTLSQGVGKYTFVTQEGEYIIVNGIVASPFALNHLIANSIYDVYRFMYKVLSSLKMTQFVYPMMMSTLQEIGSLGVY